MININYDPTIMIKKKTAKDTHVNIIWMMNLSLCTNLIGRKETDGHHLHIYRNTVYYHRFSKSQNSTPAYDRVYSLYTTGFSVESGN